MSSREHPDHMYDLIEKAKRKHFKKETMKTWKLLYLFTSWMAYINLIFIIYVFIFTFKTSLFGRN